MYQCRLYNVIDLTVFHEFSMDDFRNDTFDFASSDVMNHFICKDLGSQTHASEEAKTDLDFNRCPRVVPFSFEIPAR